MAHAVTRGDPGAVDHLFDVWELMYDPTATFDAKLGRLLEIETEAFDLPYGFLTRVDPATDTQLIETARGSHDLLQDGETAPLSESYCRETIREPEGVFWIDDAHEEEWTADPAYRRFELGTYVGATVEDGETLYGTLCFASSEPRETALTEPERRFLKLLGRWVGDVFEDRIACECGANLPLEDQPAGERMSVVSCEECGSRYAVTVSRLDHPSQ
jgi:hypothetical protein